MHTLKIKPGADGQWRFSIIAPNGETIIPPEAHPESKGALRAARGLCKIFGCGLDTALKNSGESALTELPGAGGLPPLLLEIEP
jgi:uncharacterized protein YegP (UPF0339 family)